MHNNYINYAVLEHYTMLNRSLILSKLERTAVICAWIKFSNANERLSSLYVFAATVRM